jgi:hypothetical protein
MANVLPPSGALTLTVVETMFPAKFDVSAAETEIDGAGLLSVSFLQEDRESMTAATTTVVPVNTFLRNRVDFIVLEISGLRTSWQQTYRFGVIPMLP